MLHFCPVSRRKRQRRTQPVPPLWFGLTWLGIGLVFLAIGIGAAWSYVRTEREYGTFGVPVEAMVLTKSKGRPRSGSLVFQVTYRYRAQGYNLEGTGSVSSEQWNNLTERGPIRILFLPGTEESRIEGSSGRVALPLIFSILGTVITAGSLATIHWHRRNARGAR